MHYITHIQPRFTLWLEEQLHPYTESNSIIVLNNTSYHSTQLDYAPTNANRKCQPAEWLVLHRVDADIT